MSQVELHDLEKLADTFEECERNELKSPAIVLNGTCDPTLEAKFPKPRSRVPPVFLHKPIKFPPLMQKVLNLGIKFYLPCVGQHYTKICCQTLDDHKALTQYFTNKQLPYHTFGYPENRKMKVVIRGLPEDVDLDSFRRELELVSIPIVRIHKMKNKECAVNRPFFVLLVVPNNEQGRKILLLQKFLDHIIKIEPLKFRILQCHRCQKWGHAQRYCNGQVKCVKCGGDHVSEKCTRDPFKLPPKCANCGCEHTASFRQCPFSPISPQYVKKMLATALTKQMFPVRMIPKKLITPNNCHIFLRGRI